MLTTTRTARRTLGAILFLSLISAALVFAAPAKPSRKKPAVPKLPITQTKPAPAQTNAPAPGDVVLYNGLSADQSGLTLADWGGGSVQDSTELAFANNHALKVTTLGLYQGAKITFSTPVALGDIGANKDRYFQIALRFAQQEQQTPAYAPGQFPGGFPGAMGRTAEPTATRPPVTAVRLVFTFDNGAQVDTLRPLPESSDSENGNSEEWVSVSVPLAALKFPAGTAAGAKLKSLTIGGDNYGVFYLGQMKLLTDDTPITCFAGDQQDVARGDLVTLHGSGSGGASTLRFSWDFDSSDGITDQAQGRTAYTQYYTGGKDYTVTLTVSDIDGLKTPAKSTTTIKVEP